MSGANAVGGIGRKAWHGKWRQDPPHVRAGGVGWLVRRCYRNYVCVMETEADGTQTTKPYLMSFIAVSSASPRPENRGKESYILLARTTSAAPGKLVYAEQRGDFAPGRTWLCKGLQDQTSHASVSYHPEPGESEEIARAKDQEMLQK